jgi:hypothetical protein
VVAADPQGPGNKVMKLRPNNSTTQPAVLMWQENDNQGQTALNVGSQIKREGGSAQAADVFFYAKPYPHGAAANPRWWGPSSNHPGSVLHGFADGHGKAINEDIDRNTYLHAVTRAGSEVTQIQ